jgi:hypothetical protein
LINAIRVVGHVDDGVGGGGVKPTVMPVAAAVHLGADISGQRQQQQQGEAPAEPQRCMGDGSAASPYQASSCPHEKGRGLIVCFHNLFLAVCSRPFRF